MTTPLIFDLETDGLDPSVVHCLVINKEGKTHTFAGNRIPNGLDMLSDNLIVAHNVIKYDLPVLKKLYGYSHKKELVHDTLVLSRLIYPDIKELDMKLIARGRMRTHLVNKHNLESWGCRLQLEKGDFNKANDWSSFSDEMLQYCIQDVKITEKLYNKLLEKQFNDRSINLEHEVAFILRDQEKKGFGFNVDKAVKLHAHLLNKINKLKRSLENRFKSWTVDLGEFIPKVNNKKFGYKKGVPVKKSKVVAFNPSSRQHIANRLMKLNGWKPTKFTDTGQPIIDEEVLSKLKYPEAKELNEYLTLEKRLGMLADGKNAWLKVHKKGRIHTFYVTNIITGRMAARFPNLQQVPSLHTPYGKECRELFVPSDGKVLVGADASGIEARCFGHYIYNYKGGKEYTDLILNGDIHSYNMKAAGLEDRQLAKTMFYAILYGCSFKKLSQILQVPLAEGKIILDRFYLNLPFLKEIKQDIFMTLEDKGFIRAIDGRKLQIRSSHSALNSLIQSCAAIVMKQALIILWSNLKGIDAFVVANIHDEFQIETTPELAERVGKIATQSIREAGQRLKLRVSLEGEYKIGKSWADTH
jgi:DNA polymerase I-like protein with 3'-5' exonuclease and polymerase domains